MKIKSKVLGKGTGRTLFNEIFSENTTNIAMKYNVYKSARDAAWQFLIDNSVTSLPLQFGDICRKNGIRLWRDVNSVYLSGCERGVTFLKNGQYNILVNGADSLQIQRYTIGHELGHIYMHHPMNDGVLGRTFGLHHHPVSFDEYQAERFSMDILAPACVLWALNLRSPADIARLCNIDRKDAAFRAERMRLLYKRNMFLVSDLEKQVYQQFIPFVNSFNN